MYTFLLFSQMSSMLQLMVNLRDLRASYEVTTTSCAQPSIGTGTWETMAHIGCPKIPQAARWFSHKPRQVFYTWFSRVFPQFSSPCIEDLTPLFRWKISWVFPYSDESSRLQSSWIRSWALVGTDMHLQGHPAFWRLHLAMEKWETSPKKWEKCVGGLVNFGFMDVYGGYDI